MSSKMGTMQLAKLARQPSWRTQECMMQHCGQALERGKWLVLAHQHRRRLLGGAEEEAQCQHACMR